MITGKYNRKKLREIQRKIDEDEKLIMLCLDRIEQNNVLVLKAEKRIASYNNCLKVTQRRVIDLKRQRGEELPLLDKALLNLKNGELEKLNQEVN